MKSNNTTLNVGLQSGAVLMPLLSAFLLMWVINNAPRDLVAIPAQPVYMLKKVYVNTVNELEALFDETEYHWPPFTRGEVPRLEVISLPMGLDEILDVRHKKALFFKTILPVVLEENDEIGRMRQRAQALFSAGLHVVGEKQLRWLEAIAKEYRVKGDLTQPETQSLLLRRLDQTPVSLALAQAANESGWGSSRFALDANNLYGQWTFKAGKGLVPANRDAGLNHAIRIFPSLRESVKSYLYNINVSFAYEGLRRLREDMRREGLGINGYLLAGGLVRYSERGEEYVQEIRSIIRGNQLDWLDADADYYY